MLLVLFYQLIQILKLISLAISRKAIITNGSFHKTDLKLFYIVFFQDGKGYPQDGKVYPQDGKGYPQYGKVYPHGEKDHPQGGKGSPQGAMSLS